MWVQEEHYDVLLGALSLFKELLIHGQTENSIAWAPRRAQAPAPDKNNVVGLSRPQHHQWSSQIPHKHVTETLTPSYKTPGCQDLI